MLLYLVFSLGSLITAIHGYSLAPTQACDRGFRNSGYPLYMCLDVDECNSGNSPCEQNCGNSQGSYDCSCRSGYVVSTTDPTKCEPLRQVCGRGFRNSGYPLYICLDIDECNLRTPPCEQICRNRQGSYKCTCVSGYDVSTSDTTKCERPSITSYSTGLQANPRHPASFIGDTLTLILPILVNNLSISVLADVDACSTGRRCEHICTIISTGRKCSCNPGYVINAEDNTTCDEVEICKTKADVILVFDASGSIGEEHFDKQFVFAKKLTSNFKLGPSGVRFGGIVYSRFAEKLFDLKDHSTLKTLHKALSNVTYMSSSTYTNEAFKLIDKQQLFSTAKGGRGDAPDIVVLFTDGNPTDVDKALESAQRLKDIGILVLGVAIGSELDLSVLKKITSTPDDALAATSYDAIENIEKRLRLLLCEVSGSSK